jgi:hypothetical protein
MSNIMGGSDSSSAQTASGRDPLVWLSGRLISVRLDMVQSPEGIVPVSRHRLKSKTDRSGNCASSVGMLTAIGLESRARLVRDARVPRPVGIVSATRSSCTAATVQFLQQRELGGDTPREGTTAQARRSAFGFPIID